jgi:folate-binding protein YgfZ
MAATAKMGPRQGEEFEVSEAGYVRLTDRGVIGIAGEEARNFLQGLISNDIEKVGPARAIYAALLTPQGKYLFDFLISELDGRLLLESEAARLPDLIRRLMLYRLRARVEITDESAAFDVVAFPGETALQALDLPADAGAARVIDGGVLMVDPRLAALGARALLPKDAGDPFGLSPLPPERYQGLRYRLGVPEGEGDLQVERATLLESGFDELNGVDFKKGCFVGQELTARMKYRGLVRKRLLPVSFDGPPPPPGTPIKADGREVGEMRGGIEGLGLALFRIDKLEAAGGETLSAEGQSLLPARPDWAKI